MERIYSKGTLTTTLIIGDLCCTTASFFSVLAYTEEEKDEVRSDPTLSIHKYILLNTSDSPNKSHPQLLSSDDTPLSQIQMQMDHSQQLGGSCHHANNQICSNSSSGSGGLQLVDQHYPQKQMAAKEDAWRFKCYAGIHK